MGLWNRTEQRRVLPKTGEEDVVPQGPAFLEAEPVLRTSLGPDDVITGRLNFSAPTRIDGTLRGEVRASGLLVIGETARIDGTIRGTTVVILGRVRGDVLGALRVELGPRGVLRGTVETQDLVVREGGVLDGTCKAVPLKANVHPLTKRASSTPDDPGEIVPRQGVSS